MQVGKVAAAAAGDENLFPNALRAFQHGHAAAAFAGFNGAHQAGCASTKNQNIDLFFHERRMNQLNLLAFHFICVSELE